MNLTDAADMQEDSEEVFGEPILAFKFRTRDTENRELVEREYEFAHAPEWDEWWFSAYIERRCDASSGLSQREWRIAQDLSWDDPDAADVDVPQAILEKLSSVTSIDNIKLSK